MTTAVTLSSLILRTAITLQTALTTSMLASLALERVQVRRKDLASVSIARESNGGPYMLSWWLARAYQQMHGRRKSCLLLCLAAFIVVTTTLSQFASTSLTRDLSIGIIPASPTGETINTNFLFNQSIFNDGIHNRGQNRYSKSPFGPSFMPQIMRPSSWLLKPAIFPKFAEYRDGSHDPRPEFADTGNTLRAFLPFSNARDRQMLRNYTGKATVMDARVICVRPNFTNPLYANYGEGGDFVPFETYGFAARTVMPEVAPPRFSFTDEGKPRSLASGPKCAGGGPGNPNEWGLSLCQLGTEAGNMFSQFHDSATFNVSTDGSGLTFLALNISGTMKSLQNPLPLNSSSNYLGKYSEEVFDSYAPSALVPNNEWLDMYFCTARNDSCKLSASICYSSLDSAELAVDVWSSSVLSEPSVSFSQKLHTLRSDSIGQQLGQASDGTWFRESADARGIYELAPRTSWIPKNASGDYEYAPVLSAKTGSESASGRPFSFLVNAANMEAQAGTPTSGDAYFLKSAEMSWSAPLCSGHTRFHPDAYIPKAFRDWITTDATLIGLAQDILANGGDVAHVVQSLLTVMAANTYYDQLPQFDGTINVTTTVFVQALIPTSRRGFVAVAVVAALHLVLLAAVTVTFALNTHASQLGNTWRVVAQLVQDKPTLAILDRASLATDAQVEALMNADGTSCMVDDDGDGEPSGREDGRGRILSSATDVVGLVASADGTSVELVTAETGVGRRARRKR
ncbi:MAG: Mitochondrial outer membrane protein iml2 [Piccolia ochrophora]|nr:MAG: Mitochondrial outer membrane protein iml2 [Piccolia ochrophora]